MLQNSPLGKADATDFRKMREINDALTLFGYTGRQITFLEMSMKLRHLIIAAAACALSAPAFTSQPDVKHIRFVMAHKPDNADNVALIQKFADNVERRTQGAIKITPIMPDKMVNFNPYENDHTQAFKQLYTGEVEMGQVSIKKFFYAAPEIAVLDMPMLFTNHDHVAKVLDGEVGKDLLASVKSGTNGNIQSLAFTYSGGFRNLYSTEAVKSISDLRGMTTRYPGSTMTRDLVDMLGMRTKSAEIGTPMWFRGIEDKSLNVEEAELIRLSVYETKYPKFFKKVNTVLETNHNLYLTMVSVNGRFFDKLSAKQQDIIKEEAFQLSLQERNLSIEQAIQAKERFEKEYGITFVPMSEEDRTLLRTVSQQIYKKHNKALGGWMQAIADIDPNSAYAAMDQKLQ